MYYLYYKIICYIYYDNPEVSVDQINSQPRKLSNTMPKIFNYLYKVICIKLKLQKWNDTRRTMWRISRSYKKIWFILFHIDLIKSNFKHTVNDFRSWSSSLKEASSHPFSIKMTRREIAVRSREILFTFHRVSKRQDWISISNFRETSVWKLVYM